MYDKLWVVSHVMYNTSAYSPYELFETKMNIVCIMASYE